MTDYSINSTNWSVGDTITVTSSNATGVGITGWIINFNEDDYDYGLENLNARGKLFAYTNSANPNNTLSVDITDAHSRIYTLTPVTITVGIIQHLNNVFKPISECLELSVVTVDIGTTITVTMNHNIYTKLKYLVNRWTRYKEDISNKVTSISSSSTHTQYPSAKLMYNKLETKENSSNKVTSVSSSSTDTQYPSAKLLYDQLETKASNTHTHGNISNDGKISIHNLSADTNDYIATIDVSDSYKIIGSETIRASHIADTNAHENLGTNVLERQSIINTKIDDKILEICSKLYGKFYYVDNWNNTSSNSTISINNNSVTGTAICNHLLIEELTDTTNYVFEFDVIVSNDNRSCIKIGGDDYDSDDNYYQIVTDINNTMIQLCEDGDWTTIDTLSSNYFVTETKHWKFIRKNDNLTLYIDGAEIYTFDNMNDHTNRFGFGKWGNGTITLSNFKLQILPYVESQPIRTYADLNDYTEIGFYYSPTATVSSTLSNCPVTNAFSLFVEKSSGYENACTQTLTSYDGTIIKKFSRFIQTVNGTLQDSGWVQIPLSSQYVPNGSDLNDYTNVGMYYNGANTETTNITNLPNNDHTAFCLFVEDMGGNAKKQTWTKQSDINSMFVRIRKWDNTWTSWKPVWEDTAWTNVTFKSNYGNYSSTEAVQYRRVGKVVQIRGTAKNTNTVTLSGADTLTEVATINDTSCRPSRTVRFVQQGSGMNRFTLYVTESGTIKISRYGTTSVGNIPTGAWLNMACTFLVD